MAAGRGELAFDGCPLQRQMEENCLTQQRCAFAGFLGNDSLIGGGCSCAWAGGRGLRQQVCHVRSTQKAAAQISLADPISGRVGKLNSHEVVNSHEVDRSSWAPRTKPVCPVCPVSQCAVPAKSGAETRNRSASSRHGARTRRRDAWTIGLPVRIAEIPKTGAARGRLFLRRA